MSKIIQLKNMSYSIPHGAKIIDQLDLELDAGIFLGILGHNGAGKTTLIDILMGFRKASTGEVLVMGENPHAIARAHRKDVAFISQDVSLKASLTIRQFLDFTAGFYPQYSQELEQHLLTVFSIKEEMKIASLSLGQQKKVQIVSSLSALPKLVLIDEITAVLDPEARSIFFKEIEHYRKKHPCVVLLATNIAEDLINRVDRILFLKDSKADLYSPEDIGRLFNLHKVVA